MAELRTARAVVEEMLRKGASFDDIEDYIEHAPLPEQQQSALWLYAWAREDHRSHRDVPEEALALVAD
jgi:hypothetical protein